MAEILELETVRCPEGSARLFCYAPKNVLLSSKLSLVHRHGLLHCWYVSVARSETKEVQVLRLHEMALTITASHPKSLKLWEKAKKGHVGDSFMSFAMKLHALEAANAKKGQTELLDNMVAHNVRFNSSQINRTMLQAGLKVAGLLGKQTYMVLLALLLATQPRVRAWGVGRELHPAGAAGTKAWSTPASSPPTTSTSRVGLREAVLDPGAGQPEQAASAEEGPDNKRELLAALEKVATPALYHAQAPVAADPLTEKLTKPSRQAVGLVRDLYEGDHEDDLLALCKETSPASVLLEASCKTKLAKAFRASVQVLQQTHVRCDSTARPSDAGGQEEHVQLGLLSGRPFKEAIHNLVNKSNLKAFSPVLNKSHKARSSLLDLGQGHHRGGAGGTGLL